MKTCSTIQFKAAFLTLVFLLNTIVGFACAVGTDMGFNKEHSGELKTAHSHTSPHTSSTPHDHTKHSHDKNSADHHAQKESKDNCCKEQVAKLTKADKLHQSGFDYSLLALPSFILPAAVSHFGSPSDVTPVNVPNVYFGRHCRPPISDVRIAIQSFQI